VEPDALRGRGRRLGTGKAQDSLVAVAIEVEDQAQALHFAISEPVGQVATDLGKVQHRRAAEDGEHKDGPQYSAHLPGEG